MQFSCQIGGIGISDQYRRMSPGTKDVEVYVDSGGQKGGADPPRSSVSTPSDQARCHSQSLADPERLLFTPSSLRRTRSGASGTEVIVEKLGDFLFYFATLYMKNMKALKRKPMLFSRPLGNLFSKLQTQICEYSALNGTVKFLFLSPGFLGDGTKSYLYPLVRSQDGQFPSLMAPPWWKVREA